MSNDNDDDNNAQKMMIMVMNESLSVLMMMMIKVHLVIFIHKKHTHTHTENYTRFSDTFDLPKVVRLFQKGKFSLKNVRKKSSSEIIFVSDFCLAITPTMFFILKKASKKIIQEKTIDILIIIIISTIKSIYYPELDKYVERTLKFLNWIFHFPP